ncbi:MAG: hypothetical protein K6F21_06770, partial [Bacteroidales bacterium]|nr:hypothetical protein [Bacteroidales bacterium]
MQNNIKEDFDLQVRSMMEDAQEPAPAGAWRAISSRLDAIQGAPAAAAHRVWYWAGAALAMAAAVTLGIFFIGTSDNNSKLININSSEALVAENTAPVSSETMVEPQAVEAATPALKATARQLRAVAAPKARTVAEEPVATQPVAESTQP